MPYIKKEARENFAALADLISKTEIETAGNLNYLITTLCKKFMKESTENYDQYNTIVGVLECAKLEFYRRRVASYENQKIVQNGDVYG